MNSCNMYLLLVNENLEELIPSLLLSYFEVYFLSTNKICPRLHFDSHASKYWYKFVLSDKNFSSASDAVIDGGAGIIHEKTENCGGSKNIQTEILDILLTTSMKLFVDKFASSNGGLIPTRKEFNKIISKFWRDQKNKFITMS